MTDPGIETCTACGEPIFTDKVNFIVRGGGIYHFACAFPPDPDFPYRHLIPGADQ